MLIISKVDGNVIELTDTAANKMIRVGSDNSDSDALRKQAEILLLAANACNALGQRKMEKEHEQKQRFAQQQQLPKGKYN